MQLNTIATGSNDLVLFITKYAVNYKLAKCCTNLYKTSFQETFAGVRIMPTIRSLIYIIEWQYNCLCFELNLIIDAIKYVHSFTLE